MNRFPINTGTPGIIVTMVLLGCVGQGAIWLAGKLGELSTLIWP